MKTQIIFITIFVLLVCINLVSAFSIRHDDAYLNIIQEYNSTHKYHYPNYICVDMSFDLMTLLNRQGYLTSRKVGHYYTDADNKTCSPFNQAHWNCKHTWLEVWVYDNETCNNKLIRVEATSGKIIPDKVYQAHYR